MIKNLILICVFLCFALVSSAQANDLESLAKKTISNNPDEVAKAIAELRQSKNNGLETLLKVFAPDIEKHLSGISPEQEPNWKKISQAIDTVSQQKDAHSSKLYWYTDFNQAQEAAKRSGKPILSLRLLGNLIDDLSCANSRFFRTILYPNKEISEYLQQNYILHWKSVRPAPKMTIDFGDGRKLERTITGNSIHYILDSEGNLVDALPGLHSPKAFLFWLNRSLIFAKQSFIGPNKEGLRLNYLQQYHRNSIAETGNRLAKELEIVGEKDALTALTLGMIPNLGQLTFENNQQQSGQIVQTSNNESKAKALDAAPIAMTKAIVEVPIIRQMNNNLDEFKTVANDSTWNKLASIYLSEVQLDNNSLILMRSKLSKGENTDPIAKIMDKLTFSIAKDTVYNEYLLHTQIHQWLLDARNYKDLEAFNDKVYAELFLTPKTDPWLGLKSDDVYSAIEADGLVK
ncbi:MAG: hypothetical protein J0M03_17220 [Acidobacteria bacterium]|nr:hypothetical protein [Acidobacteriota bacterium]